MSYPPPGPPGPPGPPAYPMQPPYAPGPPGPPPPGQPPHGPPFPGPPPGQPPPPYPGGPQGFPPGPPYGAPPAAYPPPGCPPQAGYPGAPGYLPPGQGYPTAPPGQAYPTPLPPGYPPAGGGYPPGAGAGYPHGTGYPQSMGRDSCDSDPEFGDLKSVDNDNRFRVKFINNTRKQVFLFWVNFKGSFEKFCKIRPGGHEEVDTFKNHVWLAMKKKKKRPFLVNKNWVYFASAEDTTVNIERPPRRGHRRDKQRGHKLREGRKNRRQGFAPSGSGRPVLIKFINRTRCNAYLHTIQDQGKPSITKVLSPGKCWSVNSFEGQTWNVSDDKDRSKNLLLNHGWFYCAVRTRRLKERVVITDKYWMGSSSGSSSSSSSD